MRDPLVCWVTVLVCVVVALLNVAAHWFPWQVVPGAMDDKGRLRRLLAYAWGTGTILAGMVAVALVWTLAGRDAVSPWLFVLVLAAMMAAAGAGTVVTYAVDLAGEHRALVEDVADLEQVAGL